MGNPLIWLSLCCILPFLSQCSSVGGSSGSSGSSGSLYSSCSRLPASISQTRYPSQPTDKRLRKGDQDFEIKVFEDDGRAIKAYRFQANKMYEVVLRNRLVNVGFEDFYMVAVIKHSGHSVEEEMENRFGELVHVSGPGGHSQEVLYCPGLVKGKSLTSAPLYEVRLKWSAPAKPTGCVQFRATVVRSNGDILKDSGMLTKTLCPEETHMMKDGTVMEDKQVAPKMVMSCCACGTATYRMTFQGLWTKETHPKDWPKQSGLIHWTNLVGASHDEKYMIYYEGGMASQAVQSICTYGDATVLDQEFQSKAVWHLKDLIKAQGMWSESEMGENRSTIFSVNRTHHLFSFLTMMGPSTDWCTGISSEDLCLSDCSWAQNKVIDLYPWDAGIKEGDTYIPLNTDRQDIPDPIRRISDSWLPGNPFTKDAPVARVYLERLSPREKWQCPMKPLEGVMPAKWDKGDLRSGESRDPNGQLRKTRQGDQAPDVLSDPSLAQMATFLCITSEWTPWTSCSVTCGIGKSVRSREMLVNKKNELCQHVPLTEMQSCEGRKRTCDYTDKCSLLPWSEWNICNATCEVSGVQSRSRLFARSSEEAECLAQEGASTRYLLREYRPCEKSKGECDILAICGDGRRDGYACGKPMQRFYYDAHDHRCKPFIYLGCKGSRNNFPTKSKCEMTCLQAVEQLPQWRREKMALLQQRGTVTQKGKEKMKKMQVSGACKLELDVGRSCSMKKKPIPMSPTTHWYYDYRLRRCLEFTYLGCEGNENRFADYSSCIKDCKPEDHINMLDDFTNSSEKVSILKQDCVLSEWSAWSPCSQLCGGKQTRWRYILKPSMNGGKACGMLQDEKQCHETGCVSCQYTTWSAWSPCSKTCGIGFSKSMREMLPSSAACVPQYPHTVKTQLCNMDPCPLM